MQGSLQIASDLGTLYNLGRVFTRDDLVKAVWGEEFEDSAISIPTYIRRIRMKIEPDPSNPAHLKTVWRFGYRLE